MKVVNLGIAQMSLGYTHIEREFQADFCSKPVDDVIDPHEEGDKHQHRDEDGDAALTRLPRTTCHCSKQTRFLSVIFIFNMVGRKNLPDPQHISNDKSLKINLTNILFHWTGLINKGNENQITNLITAAKKMIYNLDMNGKAQPQFVSSKFIRK